MLTAQLADFKVTLESLDSCSLSLRVLTEAYYGSSPPRDREESLIIKADDPRLCCTAQLSASCLPAGCLPSSEEFRVLGSAPSLNQRILRFKSEKDKEVGDGFSEALP